MKFSRCSLLGKWERYSSQIAVQKQMTLRYNYYLIKLASVGVYDTHKLNTVLICPLCSSLNSQNNTHSATSCKKTCHWIKDYAFGLHLLKHWHCDGSEFYICSDSSCFLAILSFSLVFYLWYLNYKVHIAWVVFVFWSSKKLVYYFTEAWPVITKSCFVPLMNVYDYYLAPFFQSWSPDIYRWN
jgi:hypothetical protein